jgi:hypothetical protein
MYLVTIRSRKYYDSAFLSSLREVEQYLIDGDYYGYMIGSTVSMDDGNAVEVIEVKAGYEWEGNH